MRRPAYLTAQASKAWAAGSAALLTTLSTALTSVAAFGELTRIATLIVASASAGAFLVAFTATYQAPPNAEPEGDVPAATLDDVRAIIRDELAAQSLPVPAVITPVVDEVPMSIPETTSHVDLDPIFDDDYGVPTHG